MANSTDKCEAKRGQRAPVVADLAQRYFAPGVPQIAGIIGRFSMKNHGFSGEFPIFSEFQSKPPVLAGKPRVIPLRVSIEMASFSVLFSSVKKRPSQSKFSETYADLMTASVALMSCSWPEPTIIILNINFQCKMRLLA